MLLEPGGEASRERHKQLCCEVILSSDVSIQEREILLHRFAL